MTREIRPAHTVEKIGGTSMSDYQAVRDSVILGGEGRRNHRIFVVSAYAGMTDLLLESKHTGRPGVFALFANNDGERDWEDALDEVQRGMREINAGLFEEGPLLDLADAFIGKRLDDARGCLNDLQSLCEHGHFELESHLQTVREMLASLGEAHSAWNTAELLKRDGISARFVDLSGWKEHEHLSLDEHIQQAFAGINLALELPIATGYTHCEDGLMSSYDRGYSEITFSRIAVLTGAREAIIHKEYHLSSADPRMVGADRVVPIGRTNYDVADQLANLGMEAIHPRAAKGLRQHDIPLRVKNTFEPKHAGTLVTRDYVSDTPRVEIIAGRRDVFAVECFDQEMSGFIASYDSKLLSMTQRFKAGIVTKDINANTITHYLSCNLKTVKRVRKGIQDMFPDCEIQVRKVAVVSAVGSDMKVPGMLSRAVSALADAGISILAMHQSMRQVDMQFVVDVADYEGAVRALHGRLIEVHDHGEAICAA
ncbi:MAG: aspartate kinase [Oceanococcus sp.]